MFAYPRAAEIGIKNEVKANMVVLNGTISIDAGSKVQGSFIAQDIAVGANVQVALDSSFYRRPSQRNTRWKTVKRLSQWRKNSADFFEESTI